ncbi:MAG: hypothetical protein H6816_08805 [Phycisphaerales bacterium]|nr:hypothetical protein [Phycisphaerales bacterium]
MGCHASEGRRTATGSAALRPELSRLGEKANYPYIVDWIHDTPDWSLMPNPGLTTEEADIASYLMTKAGQGNLIAEADTSPNLTDASLREEGKQAHPALLGAGLPRHRGLRERRQDRYRADHGGQQADRAARLRLYTHAAERNEGRTTTPRRSRTTTRASSSGSCTPEFFDEGKHFEDPLAKSRGCPTLVWMTRRSASW